MVDLIFQIILCVIIMLFPLYMIWEMIKGFFGFFKTPKTVKSLIKEQEIKKYSIESITIENEYERN